MKTEHPALSSHRSSAEACDCEVRSDAAFQLHRLRALSARAVSPTLLALALVSLAPLPAIALEITLPVEKVRLADSPLPGAALAGTMCSTCHSAEYVLYQPPTSPRTYWKATVVKMQKVFGAPIPDSAVDPITDYLVKLYGVDQPSSPASPNTTPAQPAK